MAASNWGAKKISTEWQYAALEHAVRDSRSKLAGGRRDPNLAVDPASMDSDVRFEWWAV